MSYAKATVALRLGLFTMKSNPPSFSDGSRGSIVLLASTSGYFGGTGVAAYVASKHGIIGLLRSSQTVAQDAEIRLNAVAPYFTPTQITAGFAKEWKAAGLETNTPEGVASVIAQMALDSNRHGACALVSTMAYFELSNTSDCILCQTAGNIIRELESTRSEMVALWLGEDVRALMTNSANLFAKMGGYPLPKLPLQA